MTPEERKEYYIKNRERRLAYQKRYYQLRKEMITRSTEKRKEKDPQWEQKQREYNQEYYLKNKKKIAKKRSQTKNRG